jgi:hypothetical protein
MRNILRHKLFDGPKSSQEEEDVVGGGGVGVQTNHGLQLYGLIT